MVTQKGFTIMELMIVVVVIGILASFAIPSYTDYVIRTNRADMQAEMVRISQDLQRYQIANKSFNKVTLSTVKATGNYPANKPLYTLKLTQKDGLPIPATDMPKVRDWLLVATPMSGRQYGNGVICLNSDGHKFWAKGATTCSLSATSKWDDR